MQKSEIFAARVPRYTSYPAAPHFHAGTGQGIYRQWLAQIAPREPLSLYLHIPFCDTLCWFCGCHTSVVNNYAPVREYCDLLLKEIGLVAEAPGKRHSASGPKRTFPAVEFGGAGRRRSRLTAVR